MMKLHRILATSPEIWLFLCFMGVSSITNQLSFLFIAVILYGGVISLISKDITKTLWILLVSTLLIYQGRFFTSLYTVPSAPDITAYITFHISFADGVLLLLLYRLIRTKKDYHTFRLSSIELLTTLVIIASSIASYFSILPEISWFFTLQLLKYFTVYYFSRLLLRKPEYHQITMNIIICFIAANALLMIAQKLNNGPLGLPIEDPFTRYGAVAQESKSLYRPGGVFWDPNLAASFISMGFIFLFNQWLYGYTSRARFYLLVLLLSASILSASRGNWIILFTLTISSYFMHQHNHHLPLLKKLNRKQFIGICLVILICAPPIVDRVLQFGTQKGIDTIGFRLRHMLIMADFALKKPYGIGLNVFQYQLMNNYEPSYYLYDPTPAHNIIAEVMSDLGIAGVFLLLIPYLIIKSTPIHSKTDLYNVAVSYILAAQMYPLLFSTQISMLFWIVLGALHEANTKKA